MNWNNFAYGKKLALTMLVGSLLLSGIFYFLTNTPSQEIERISIHDVLTRVSQRRSTQDIIIVGDNVPLYGLIATPLACWYDITSDSALPYGLKPLLIASETGLSDGQGRFVSNYGRDSMLLLGDAQGDGVRLTGNPYEVSVKVAKHEFEMAAGVLIVPDTPEGYALGVGAGPLSSYLNIPVIVVDGNTNYNSLKKDLSELAAKYTIVLGSDSPQIAQKIGLDAIFLTSRDEIIENTLVVIKNRFGIIDYVTMTNPLDVLPPSIVNITRETIEEDVSNVKIETGRTETEIVGESTKSYALEVGPDINLIEIYVNFTSVSSTPLNPIKDSLDIEPLIFATLMDDSGNVAAYGPSFSLDVGRTYLHTLAIDAPGTYTLEVTVYYGTAGFDTWAGTELGISRIDGHYQVNVVQKQLSKPHHPIFEKTSMMASYLTAAHGGVVISAPEFELTNDDYAISASGHSTGPWYDDRLCDVANERVMANVNLLNSTMVLLEEYGLYENYINGSAWLAIMGGGNMIPMYYEPKDSGWAEDSVYGVGWATDIHYSLDLKLSWGRPLGQDIADVSVLIARTLFYESYASGHSASIQQEYGTNEKWLDHFHFLAGEGGGRTGWFFWQKNFAPEVEQHGFTAEVYVQDYENDRQTMEDMGAYERANYFDLMLHGNWYWYVPELNGFDRYSTGVKVSDIMTNPGEWELGPSVINSGVCIMGRIDGIPSAQSITMAFLHAGINAFYSSTRSTGSEAKAGTIETSLLYDDLSVGESLRLDKLTNTEPPAFYVRNLYADPAFNPYEPENGFSDQGRPVLIHQEIV